MSISLVHCLLPHFRNSFVPMQFWNARHKMQTSVSWEMMITAGYPFCPSCTAGRIRWPSPSSCVLCRSGTSWCPILKHLSLTFTNITLSWRHLLYSCFFHSLMRKAMRHELLPMLVRNFLYCLTICLAMIFCIWTQNYYPRRRRGYCVWVRLSVSLSVCLLLGKKLIYFLTICWSPPFVCLSSRLQPNCSTYSLKFSEIMVTDPATVPHWSFIKFGRP